MKSNAEMWEQAMQDAKAEIARLEPEAEKIEQRIRRLRCAVRIFAEHKHNEVLWPRGESDGDEE